MSSYNPLDTCVILKIGDKEITAKPDNLQEFTQTIQSYDVVSETTFVLYDYTALILEWEILQGAHEIVYQYGYNDKLSEEYTGEILSMNLTFAEVGLTLEVKLMPKVNENGTNKTLDEKPVAFESMVPSEIVTKIAEKEGWTIGNIVTTKEVTQSNKFTMSGVDSKTFIKDTLCPVSVSEDGKSGYSLSFRNDGGQNKVYFEPMVSSLENVSVYEFIIGKDYDNIISFTPNLNNYYSLFLSGGNQASNPSSFSTNPNTTNTTNTTNTNTGGNDVDINTATNQATGNTQASTGGDSAWQAKSLDELTNKFIKVGSNENEIYTKYVSTGSYSNDDLWKITEYLYSLAGVFQYSATLELKGDPTIDPNGFVSLVVLTTDGFFHHTSGLYQIMQVTHNINGGNYTTTLEMFKRPTSIDENGELTLADNSQIVNLTPNVTIGGGTPSANNNVNIGSGEWAQIASEYVGLPYSQNNSIGNFPGAQYYDCSGFIREVYRRMGYSIPRTSTQMGNCEGGGHVVQPHSFSSLQPGDIMWKQGHVWLYIGNGQVAQAHGKGKPLDILPIDENSYYWKNCKKIIRYVGYIQQGEKKPR